MRAILCGCLFLSLTTLSFAISPDPPIADTRLSVNTLVREDIFAGWQVNSMERLARGEKNIELMLEQRPDEKAECLVWKGGAKLYRAILAHEAGDEPKFEELFQQTRSLFDEARKVGPQVPAVWAIVGGSYVLFADRLPEEHQAFAWAECYDSYKVLWKQQSEVLEHLPMHVRGELMAGLVQSTQRTGREEELAQYIAKTLEVLPDTRYATMAQRWKDDPKVAATENISCKSCHASGRLSVRIKDLASE